MFASNESGLRIGQRAPRATLALYAYLIISGLVVSAIAGCSTVSILPGQRVYVNVLRLAVERPEWRGVDLLNRQVAALESALSSRSYLRSAQATAGGGLSLPPVNPPIATAANPDRKAVADAVRASTPSAEDLRRELENEARGKMELWRRRVARDQARQKQAERNRVDNELAGGRSGLLARFRETVATLYFRQLVLRTWLDRFKSPEYNSPGFRSLYAELRDQQVAVRSSLAALEEAQNHGLVMNWEELRKRLRDLDRRFEAAIAAQNAKNQRDIDRRIEQQIAAAEADQSEEARERAALFGTTFRSPLDSRIAINVPALPASLARPVGGLEFRSAIALRAAAESELAAVKAQRQRLEQLILADTRDWVSALAAKKNQVALDTPDAGLPDRTPQFSLWLKQRSWPLERVQVNG